MVLATLDLARQTIRAIRQNLFWAFFYNTAGISLAVAGVLNPIVLRLHLFGFLHPHPVPSEILDFPASLRIDNPFRPQQIMLDPLKPKSLVGLKKCLAAFVADGHLVDQALA